MEMKFFHGTFTGQNPELLTDHIRRMASGEAPFFAATLSLVYGALARKVLPLSITSSSSLIKSGEAGDQSVIEPPPAILASNSTLDLDRSLTPSITQSSGLQESASVSGPSGIDNHTVSLICRRCGQTANSVELFTGLRCPHCRSRQNRGGRKVNGRPYMQCSQCNTPRTTLRSDCLGSNCGAVFA